ncbi:hypothetical protein NC653_029531 [Populus alba x Populus x berolinensis]|uniref:Uncharacterized protein n=1 Tax=Populus alba x Populus x berolinensis TaxID=444605 RepID=A0AAD6M555_9ROSI|nr:hypothetical protein NC653_029531 [Populus alba x Populus x berolinensis]
MISRETNSLAAPKRLRLGFVWIVSINAMCSCKQGSSRGSLNGSSPLATWDLLYEVAGEV